MIDWVNGKPNSRYWVLKVLHDNFGPGDKLVQTNGSTGQLTAQIRATKTSSARRPKLDLTESTSEAFASRAQVDLVRPRTSRLAM